MSEQPELSRRALLRNIAISATLSAGISMEAAQHVHNAAAEDKKQSGGVYQPKAFTPHEYKTLQRLADLIIPADEVSKGALDSGATEFIDLLSSHNPEMAAIYTGGIAWLDSEMQRRHAKDFIDAAQVEQTAMLDLIAYRKNQSPELGPGIHFFEWVRKMTVDAFYTSPVGIADIGYKGNVGMAQFEVPADAIQYALKRSGLG